LDNNSQNSADVFEPFPIDSGRVGVKPMGVGYRSGATMDYWEGIDKIGENGERQP
jgi:hypothetical protein